jgi:hypothetical protein
MAPEKSWDSATEMRSGHTFRDALASSLLVGMGVCAYSYFQFVGRNAFGAVALGFVFAVVFYAAVARKAISAADDRTDDSSPSATADRPHRVNTPIGRLGILFGSLPVAFAVGYFLQSRVAFAIIMAAAVGATLLLRATSR